MLIVLGTTSSQAISDVYGELAGQSVGYLPHSLPMILAVVGLGLGLRLLVHYARVAADTGRHTDLVAAPFEYGTPEYDDWRELVALAEYEGAGDEETSRWSSLWRRSSTSISLRTGRGRLMSCPRSMVRSS